MRSHPPFSISSTAPDCVVNVTDHVEVDGDVELPDGQLILVPETNDGVIYGHIDTISQPLYRLAFIVVSTFIPVEGASTSR